MTSMRNGNRPDGTAFSESSTMVGSTTGIDEILAVTDLRVSVPRRDGMAEVVRGVSFSVREEEIVALIGESGSGKTTIARSILQLVGAGASLKGAVRFGDLDLLTSGEELMRSIRGNDIGFVPQDALNALDPRLQVGTQLREVLRIHNTIDRADIDNRIDVLLEDVGLRSEVRKNYPHQLSGGMRQRILIAMAMANRPRLLIADEPTTALDVTIQAQLLNLLEEVRTSLSTSILLISHDLGVVSEIADRVVVLYAGRVMEAGPVSEVLRHPAHPYTQGLLQSLPVVAKSRSRLVAIPGQPVPSTDAPSGCPFHSRCSLMQGRTQCAEHEPELAAVIGSQQTIAACHFVEESTAVTRTHGKEQHPTDTRRVPRLTGSEPLVRIRDLSVRFSIRKRFRKRTLEAVSGISFDIRPNEVVALVGESGSGKSTTALSILGLIQEATGRIEIGGEDMLSADKATIRKLRRRMHVVLQDPYSSLNPRLTVEKAVAESVTDKEATKTVHRILGQVGLGRAVASQYPHQLSGGMRQRVGLARAIAGNPELLILDEPLSALDVSVQAQILNLLRDLSSEFGIACLFVTHDLAVARHMADRIAVMYLGRIVEIGTTDDIFTRATHPYTQALLGAAPHIPFEKEGKADAVRKRVLLKGEIPSPMNPPSGCRFRTRCPKAADLCHSQNPQLLPCGIDHLSACHFPEVKSR